MICTGMYSHVPFLLPTLFQNGDTFLWNQVVLLLKRIEGTDSFEGFGLVITFDYHQSSPRRLWDQAKREAITII
jgi:hypothetical protein